MSERCICLYVYLFSLLNTSTGCASYARVSLLVPLLRSYFIMCKHNPSIEPATRSLYPCHQSEHHRDFGKHYCGQPWSTSRSKLVIASGAPKLAMSRQKSIDITIIQNLMNPKHTRRPIRAINGDILAVTLELLQNNAKADSKVAVVSLASGGRQ
jgi:hypothetical protein